MILVTHDPGIAAAAGRIVRMLDGSIVEITAAGMVVGNPGAVVP